MLPTRKKARVTRPVTLPSARPVSPPSSFEDEQSPVITLPSARPVSPSPPRTENAGMADLFDSSSSGADSAPCAARPLIKYDLAADAQLAVTTPTSPSHGGSVRPAIKRDVVDVVQPAVVEQPAVAAPSSPSRSVVVGSPLQHPPSPSQREAFLASMHVQKVTTNLLLVNAQPGARLNFDGTIIVVYPCETNPVRRHVLLADEHGVIGITFWNQNAPKFNSSIVGTIAQLTKVMITTHAGRKSLTMNKESALVLSNKIAPFWTQLLDNPVTSIMDVHSMPLNKFVSIAGIVALMHSEIKIVRNEEKELVILRIVDRTGSVEVQSWVSKLSDFERYRDQPIQMKRMRISEFSGVKYLEIIDGNGTEVSGTFDEALDLANFWKEPSMV
jgi:hypothetical protein